MSFEDERGRRRKAEQAPETESAGHIAPKKKRGGSPEVGHALRAAYQQAVNESVPPEMLDLLGKLG